MSLKQEFPCVVDRGASTKSKSQRLTINLPLLQETKIMKSNQTAQVKKPYNKPVLTPHGAVEEVTLTLARSGRVDGD
jgi:hypothetical protein